MFEKAMELAERALKKLEQISCDVKRAADDVKRATDTLEIFANRAADALEGLTESQIRSRVTGGRWGPDIPAPDIEQFPITADDEPETIQLRSPR